jgi:hypothetical protein
MMEMLARKLKMDPFALRSKNYLREGSVNALGEHMWKFNGDVATAAAFKVVPALTTQRLAAVEAVEAGEEVDGDCSPAVAAQPDNSRQILTITMTLRIIPDLLCSNEPCSASHELILD